MKGFDRLVGAPGAFPLEHRLLNAAALVAVGCGVLAPSVYAFVDRGRPVLLAMALILTIAGGAIYHAARVRRRFLAPAIALLVITDVEGALLYLRTSGSSGSALVISRSCS